MASLILPDADERRAIVLAGLPIEGHITSKQLAGQVDLTPRTVSQALRELEEVGLARKVPAAEGSRYAWLGWRRTEAKPHGDADISRRTNQDAASALREHSRSTT